MADTPISIFDRDAVTAEERLYFEMIDRAADAAQDRVISNGRAQHAVYLIRKFFDTAERNVRVYSGKLARDLNGVLAFGDPAVCNAAVDFLSRNEKNRLGIVVEEPINWRHPLLTAVHEAGLSKQVSLSGLQSEPIIAFHFLLRDDAAFRVEVDKDKAEALVNFNDEDFGGTLKDIFDLVVRDRSTPLPAPV